MQNCAYRDDPPQDPPGAYVAGSNDQPAAAAASGTIRPASPAAHPGRRRPAVSPAVGRGARQCRPAPTSDGLCGAQGLCGLCAPPLPPRSRPPAAQVRRVPRRARGLELAGAAKLARVGVVPHEGTPSGHSQPLVPESSHTRTHGRRSSEPLQSPHATHPRITLAKGGAQGEPSNNQSRAEHKGFNPAALQERGTCM